MTPIQAIQIIQDTSFLVVANKQTHLQLEEAIVVLRELALKEVELPKVETIPEQKQEPLNE